MRRQDKPTFGGALFKAAPKPTASMFAGGGCARFEFRMFYANIFWRMPAQKSQNAMGENLMLARAKKPFARCEKYRSA